MKEIFQVYVAGYRGVHSPISSGIRWWTHSQYSHVAVLVVYRDSTVQLWEAIAAGFVCVEGKLEEVDSVLFANHSKKEDIVDCKKFIASLLPGQLNLGLLYLESIKGQPYDFQGIASFPSGGLIPEDVQKVFCSEATMHWSWRMGAKLQNMLPRRAFPDHCMISPLLEDVELPTKVS